MRMTVDNRKAGKRGALCPLLVLTLLILLGLAGTRVDATPEVVTPPKSVFVDKPEFGRDPFYPNSERRKVKVQAATNTLPVRLGFPEELHLKGLSGLDDSPLAIINNMTFSAGETNLVKVNGVKIPVHCIEIKDRSVRVSVDGMVRELFLRKDL